jgi:uncharacterized membrane protein YdjX (TVP38/TMEM64 family)
MLRPAIFLLVIGALVWISHHFELRSHLNVAAMRALVDAYEPFGPLVFMVVLIGGLLLHVPGIVFVALGGMLFGRTGGFFYGWIAGVAGATLCFVIGRYLAQDWVQHGLEKRPMLAALDHRLERNGVRTVILLRLVLFLAPPLNWGIGTSRVRFADYVTGTALGLLPGTFTTVLFADSIVARESESAGSPAAFVPAAIALLLFVGAGIVGRRWLRA